MPLAGYTCTVATASCVNEGMVVAIKGDRLLVDAQDELLFLLPQPTDYTDSLASLDREEWAGLDS